MSKGQEEKFLERERVARELWRMVRTCLCNQAGADNPFLPATLAPIERQYPWLTGAGSRDLRDDWDFEMQEETETEARERMSPTELEADLVFSDPFAEQ